MPYINITFYMTVSCPRTALKVFSRIQVYIVFIFSVCVQFSWVIKEKAFSIVWQAPVTAAFPEKQADREWW